MERIKEALDRAREQRELGIAKPDAAARPTDAPNVAAEAAAGSLKEMASALQIDYTRTKVVTPDPVVMRTKRVVAQGGGDAVADAYKMLRTRTLRAMEDNNWSTLAITSPGPEEGKSLTAVNLALSMAREIDRTVLLVDLDLRRPSIHEFFGFEVEHGISEYLSDGIELEQILVNPGIERFVILPGSGRVSNSSELLSSARMAALAGELSKRYQDRVIIYDLPPVLAVDDALAFSSLVDAFLLVVAEGSTQAEEVAAAHDVLTQANIIGTVLNKAAESQGHYYY